MPMPSSIDISSAAKRMSDEIAARLVDEIRRGVLPPDSMLPTERELCDRFSVSRPTVRQALAQMELRGYIQSGSGKRPRVAKPTLQKALLSAGALVKEVLGNAESNAHFEQLRQFVESSAVREVAAKAGNVDITRISQAMERNHGAIGTDDFPHTDVVFHREIIAAVRNPILLTLHDTFAEPMVAHRSRNADQVEADRLTYEEHQTIFRAIMDGNVEAASDAMDRHLARAYRKRIQLPGTD